MDLTKIVVMGAGAVGKSCITVRWCHGEFIEIYDPTIEDSYRRTVVYGDTAYAAEVLDTAGTEHFASMRNLYIRNGDAFLIVYSLTAPSTLLEAKEIHDEIVRGKDGQDFCCMLVANKADAVDQRLITRKEGEELARLWNARYMETSAKANTNIDDVFRILLLEVAARRKPAAKSGARGSHACAIL